MTGALVELERSFWNAAGDGAYYGEHMATNGLCVLPVAVPDKDTAVEAISAADPWDDFDFSDVRIVDLGDDEWLCATGPRHRETATNTLPSYRPCTRVFPASGS